MSSNTLAYSVISDETVTGKSASIELLPLSSNEPVAVEPAINRKSDDEAVVDEVNESEPLGCMEVHRRLHDVDLVVSICNAFAHQNSFVDIF